MLLKLQFGISYGLIAFIHSNKAVSNILRIVSMDLIKLGIFQGEFINSTT